MSTNYSSLNQLFQTFSIEERLKALYDYFDQDDVLVTSSFGTNAVLLLHLISRIRPNQQVHFIDTSYHFPETIAYREKLIRDFGLQVIDVKADKMGNTFTTKNQTWKDDPDICCQINKVNPLDAVKAKHKVWVSGVIGYQTPFRKDLAIFEEQADGMIKFHPLVDWDKAAVEAYS